MSASCNAPILGTRGQHCTQKCAISSEARFPPGPESAACSGCGRCRWCCHQRIDSTVPLGAQRLGQLKHALPVEVPVRNANQPARRSVGQPRRALTSCPDSARAVDAKHLDVHGQLERVRHLEGGITGRNVERAVVLQLQEHGRARRRVSVKYSPIDG